MKISSAVASKINRLIKERKLTLYKLENMANVTHGTMANIMSCKNESVNLKTIIMICKALNVPLSQFFDDSTFDFDNFDLDN